jgi:hypothetical protein
MTVSATLFIVTNVLPGVDVISTWCMKRVKKLKGKFNWMGWKTCYSSTASLPAICMQSTKVKTLRLCLFSSSFTQILQKGLYEVSSFIAY